MNASSDAGGSMKWLLVGWLLLTMFLILVVSVGLA